MEGKLIKTEFGFKLNSLDDIYIASEQTKSLSLKNCQAIERGYDIEALSSEYTSQFKDDDGTTDTDFMMGFLKALEILGDKNKDLYDFARDCAKNWDCDSDAHKYNTTCRMCDAEKLLQQTEWLVSFDLSIRDKDGHLILKRI